MILLLIIFYIYRTLERGGTDNLKPFTTYLDRLTGLKSWLTLSRDWSVLDFGLHNLSKLFDFVSFVCLGFLIL